MKDQLKVGLIGTGSVVREIYQYLFFNSDWADLINVTAAADPDEKALQWFCDKYDIPREARFTDYREMLAKYDFDAVQVNTPDTMHAEPTIAALEAGCDVMVPKPLAASVADGHAMIETAKRTGRIFGVDFHKRDDPRTLAAAQRAKEGSLGDYQTSVWFMLDRLMVTDPNHEPRFFASADFAEKNSPLTFLTTHMLDTLLWIVQLVPAKVTARSWSQKLPSLQPVAVDGHDMVSLNITFQNGTTAYIVTGWHLPNAAWSISIGEGRLIFTDGMLDIDGARCGVRDLSHDQGLTEPNVLFQTFEPDGRVSGFGMSKPGRIYEDIQAWQNEVMTEDERQYKLSAHETGFWVTVAVEAGLRSLAKGSDAGNGIVAGREIDVDAMLREILGDKAAMMYLE
ncbi:MAG: Gfo/Idh/MocA family protein [Verrucomicrobiota bacterium]